LVALVSGSPEKQRILLGEEPAEVFGTTYSTSDDARFEEVEESVLFQLKFLSGAVANCTTSYGCHESRRYRLDGVSGWIESDPAYPFQNLRVKVGRAVGSSEQTEEIILDPKNQFALELDHMAECVKNNQLPYTPGKDQRLIEAIYQSARTHRPVTLNLPTETTRLDRFRGTPPTT
jgi:predicted dehydrogenase